MFGYEGVHEQQGFGARNIEGEKNALDMIACNTMLNP